MLAVRSVSNSRGVKRQYKYYDQRYTLGRGGVNAAPIAKSPGATREPNIRVSLAKARVGGREAIHPRGADVPGGGLEVAIASRLRMQTGCGVHHRFCLT